MHSPYISSYWFILDEQCSRRTTIFSQSNLKRLYTSLDHSSVSDLDDLDSDESDIEDSDLEESDDSDLDSEE